MMKFLTLTNANAVTLYNLIFGLELDRIANRMRWLFLEVIEAHVLDFSDKQDQIAKGVSSANPKELDEAKAKVAELKKEIVTFGFTEENFLRGKEFFDKNIEKVSADLGKQVKEIEDAFANAKDKEEGGAN